MEDAPLCLSWQGNGLTSPVARVRVYSVQRGTGSLALGVLLLLITITTDTECESAGTEKSRNKASLPTLETTPVVPVSAWDTRGQSQAARGFGTTIKPSEPAALSNLGNLCE